MDVFVTFDEIDVECAFDVVVTDVEKEAFEVVISGVTGYPTDAQTESAFAKWMNKSEVMDSFLVIDTVSGAVASFVPNSIIPTVRGLTVDVEPVQDLHGYDSPWPAGGGVNLLSNGGAFDATRNGIRFVSDGKGTYTITGTANAVASYDFAIDAVTFPETVFIHFLNNAATYNIAFVFFDGNTQLSAPTPSSVNKITDISTSLGGKTANKLRLYVANGYTANMTISPMVCTDNTVRAFAPYSNICPISGWDSVNVQRTAINVWDEEMESGRLSAAGQPSVEASWIRTKNFTSIKPNTAYYRKSPNNIQLFWYDVEQNFLSYANWGTGAITSPSNAYYMKFHVDPVYGTTYNNDISINYPSTDTAYHSGKDNTTYQIQLGQTVYGGTVDAVNGVLTVDRVCHTYRGGTDDVITAHSYDTNNTCLSIRTAVYPHVVTDNGTGSINMMKPMCDKLPTVTFDSMRNVIAGFAAQGNWAPAMAMKVNGLSTVAEYDAWCAENEPQISWIFATPITVNLTPLEISVLTGQTNNIWADSGNVSVEYAADLKTYIDQKIAAAVAALS